jgi:class 3 adenylate cyclase
MSFRIKLLLSMMLVVGAITAATLLATQRKVQSAYEQIFEEQFQNQIAYYARLQEARLSNARERSLNFAKNVRVLAAMREFLAATNTEDRREFLGNVREVLGSEMEAPFRDRDPSQWPSSYVIDEKGQIIRPANRFGPRMQGPPPGDLPPSGAVGQLGAPPEFHGNPNGSNTNRMFGAGRFRGGPRRGPREMEIQLKDLTAALHGKEQQQVGYLAPSSETNKTRLHEVILTKILDQEDNDRMLGALVLAFPVSNEAEITLIGMSHIQSGIFLDGEIYSKSIPESTREGIAEQIAAASKSSSEGRFALTINDRPHTVMFRALNAASDFPPAYQVCVYSLDEPVRVQRDLRATILLFGGLAMLVALAVSLVLSHGFAGPIHQLVEGTRAVEKGNFEIRVPVRSKDEIGELAASFNQMTEGLALKEKYRSVLDMVTDKRIAHDLMNGKIALGGEERDISVLFCDIRGFTPLTQNMDPPEVIQMLNEHFTPLTKVVYEHHGVVDKFVGDLIMAIFGAPTSHGNDPLLAAQCALRMIEERAKLNQNSKYKISIGIGIASGKALAGRMGSADRLNYTVLGPRVNLASRLCGQAGRMEVVIDDNTYAVCKDRADAEPLGELKLKGFSEPVHAFKLRGLSA